MKYGICKLLLFIFLLLPTTLDSSDELVPQNQKFTSFVKKQKLLKQLEVNKEFKLALAKRESSLRPYVINDIGAMGLWQFLPSTLKDLGYDITPSKLRNNPDIFPAHVQEEILEKKFYEDYKVLTSQWFRVESVNYIEKYVGKEFLGVKISLPGLLAACHIGGIGGTIRFLDSNGTKNPKDLYGTSIYHYLKEFSSYEYELDFQIKQELKCLENSTPLSRQLKLYCQTPVSKDMVTVSTLKCTRASNLVTKTIQYARLCHLDSKHNYLNTTEQYSISEVVQLSSTIFSQVMGMEKLNGIMQMSGKQLFRQMPTLKEFQLARELTNSISNQFGMLRGISKSLTYFRYTGLRRLKYFPHLGEG